MRPLATLLLLSLVGCSEHSSGGGSEVGGTGGGGCDSNATGGSGSEVPSVPGGSCPDFEPCGGDIEGRWLVREACVTREQAATADIVARCPASAAAGIVLEASGSYEFSSGLLSVDFNVTSTVGVAFTSACAGSLCTDLPSLCAEYESTQATDPQFVAASCAVVADECRCTLVGNATHQGVVTSYEVSGTQIVDANGGRTDFCVDENGLSTSYADGDELVVVRLDRE